MGTKVDFIMKKGILETIVGFAVILISFIFLFYVYFINHNQKSDNGYLIKAKFQNIEGIIKGSNIMIAGIKVGTVESVNLNKDDFSVDSVLKISKGVNIPNDSNASIISSGFLGNKYISIIPGISLENLKENEAIERTQSSINIESLIGKFMYSTGSSNSKQ
jgi:phospholipid/cholesterol/gamma-HCH transport system substrate-binding protein